MQQDEKPYSWLLLSWPQIIRQETVRLNHLSPIPMTLDQQVQVVHVRRRHHGRDRVRGVGGGCRYRCCCGVRVSPRYLIKETDEELYLFLLHTYLDKYFRLF